MSAWKGGDEPLLLIGIDPILDRPMRTWKSGRSDSPGGLFIVGRAHRLPFHHDRRKEISEKRRNRYRWPVRLQGASGVSSFSVLGELAPEGLATLEGGNIAVVDIATFQEFTRIIRRSRPHRPYIHSAPQRG